MKREIKRRRLGRTNLWVTELSFGAMNLRIMNTVDEAEQLLHFVLGQGINLVDTARAYKGHNDEGALVESEVLVGKAIRNHPHLSEPIVIVTKGHGYTLEDLEADLFTSRGKLGIEGQGDLKIGDKDIKLVYFFHGINKDRWTTMLKSGVLDRIQELKKDGYINHIGFSSHYHDTEEIMAATDTGIFEVVELPYNVFNRSLSEDNPVNIFEYLYKKDIGIVNMKAFSGNSMPPIYNILKEYISIDYPAMLDFCLCNPYITTVDAGATSIRQMEMNIETACRERMSPEKLSLLIQEADKVAPSMRDVCRECMHCLEKFSCPQEVDFPGILSIYSRYTISKRLGKETSAFSEQYKEKKYDMQECIECGECLPWCEYKLNIPEMIKEAREAFL
ncbi:MAG: aldo/keto reductase [Clostridia bacterium]|jgi:predicted aldo/keto reductase-like oxidoreductase